MGLGEAVAVKVLEAGGHPMRLLSSGVKELMFRHASDEWLAHVPRAVVDYYKEADVTFNISATRMPDVMRTGTAR